jgi:BirA family biotin operon repressor/biotin-[acetyl-CoA-carboxylase] ligase
VAVARALNRWLGDRCRIKWPNDLLVDERKIAGVLLAGVSGGGGGNGKSGGGAVVGVGVNHGHDAVELAGLEPRGARGATSLALELVDDGGGGDLPSLADLTWAVVVALGEELTHVGDGPRAVERYQALSIHSPGERLRCRQPDGTLEGIFRGFDERGFLRLELASGGGGRRAGDEVLVTAGEVVAR